MNQPIKPPQEATPQKAPPSGAPPALKTRSPWRFVGTCLLLLIIVAGIVWWTKHSAAPEQAGGRNGRNAAPMSIVPEVVGKGDININLNALGTVTSLATVTIRSQISGYLQKIDFKEGDEVKKGDLLAEIDSRPYEAALAQANGNLARDEALLKGAQVDLTRYQGLAAQNAVPRQTLDTQVALVAQDQGTVEADRAAVKSAEVNLHYCHILSPLDGRVGLRQVDQGNYVTPGDTNGIVVITQLKPISVLFTVPEDNLQAISKRMQAGAMLPATALDRSGAKKIADGTLQTFDSQIDPTTGTIKLRAQFPNDNEALYPNQFVNVQLLLDTHKDVTIDADRRRAARRARHLRLSRQRRQHRLGAQGRARRHRWRPRRGEAAACSPATRSWSTAPTSCATAPRSTCARRPIPTRHPPAPALRRPMAKRPAGDDDRTAARSRIAARKTTVRNKTTDRSNESVATVHHAAGCDHAADDRHHAVRPAGVPIPAGRRPARGRLPDHSGADLLSRRQPRRDDVVGDRAAGGAVRPDAEPQPDEFDQFGRRVGDHAAVRPDAFRSTSPNRKCRPRSTPPAICCRPICRRRRSTPRSIRPTRRS